MYLIKCICFQIFLVFREYIIKFWLHNKLYLLSTTSEFMAVNLLGRGRSPEAKDGTFAINLNVVDNKCYIPT